MGRAWLTRPRFQFTSAVGAVIEPFIMQVDCREPLYVIFICDDLLAGMAATDPVGPNGEIPNGIVPPGTNRYVPNQRQIEGALRLLVRGLLDAAGLRSAWVFSQTILARWSWLGYMNDILAGTNPAVTGLLCLDRMRLARGSTAMTIAAMAQRVESRGEMQWQCFCRTLPFSDKWVISCFDSGNG